MTVAPASFLVFDDVHEQTPVHRVEALGWLVQDEQLRVVHDGHAQLDLLLLAAGKLLQIQVGFIRQLDPFQVLHGPGFGGGFGQSFEPAEVDHDVQDVLFLVQATFFRQVPEPGTVAGLEGLPVDVEGAGGGLVDAQQRSERGGFARAVAAQEPERFPGLNVEGEVFDDRCLPEVHAKVFDVN